MTPILKFFEHSHLQQRLQDVARPIAGLAKQIDESLPDGPEKSAGLRKLLEAKDCFVRALLTLLIFAVCYSASAEDRAFPRGAKPSPRHELLKAPQHQPCDSIPAQFAYVPQQLDFWGNNQYGDCVSAEEAFAKACDQPEIFVSAAEVESWAKANGYLDGADLVSVMTTMQTNGFQVGSQRYDDGKFSSVDYSTESTLQSAICVGPVKIAIDANALPSTAGNQQGWYAIGNGQKFPNTDHCVSICGYGSAEYLYSQLQVSMPPALAGTSGYLVFTWSTIGFVDHNWLMGTCAEAWVRNPTTVFVPPLSPTPPTPGPSRLTFAEVMQLLIAKLCPHLTPSQAAVAADFFADDGSPRVNLVKSIAYHRALRAGVIPAGTSIDAVNWQELLKIIQELEPIIVPLIPLLFGDEPTAAIDSLSAFAFASAPCGPKGCPLPNTRTRSRSTTVIRVAPKAPVMRTRRGSFRGVGG